MGPRAAVVSRRRSPARPLTRRFWGGGLRVLVAVPVVVETVTWGGVAHVRGKRTFVPREEAGLNSLW